MSDPGSYGRAFGDVYDSWYQDLSDPAHVVTTLASLCAPGSLIVELGGGTGRLASPLAHANRAVVSIDASAVMLQRTAQPLANNLNLTAADMATLPLDARCTAGVFIAFNTFFNLATERAQRACLAEVARVLRPEGFLAIEASIPSPTADGIATVSEARRTAEQIVLVATRQRGDVLTGSHLDFGPNGLRVRPWQLRPLTPDQIDALASLAGLTLRNRWSDWAQEPFTDESNQHVSIYVPASQ